MTNLTVFERLAPNHKVAVRGVLFALPPLLALGYIGLLQAVLPPPILAIAIGGMVGYAFSPLGAEFWIPTSVIFVQGAGGGALDTTWVVASIVLVDWFTALFLLWNFDLAERMPFLGKFIDRTEVRCRRFLEEKPWRQRLAVIALALYVALPVQMSGGVVGSILGRVMGIPRYRVFAIVAASSAAGAFPIAALASLFAPAVVAWAQGWAASGLPAVLGAAAILAFVAGIAYIVLRARRGRDETP